MPSIADIINFIPWTLFVAMTSGLLLLFAASRVVLSVNPVHAVLQLILCFICTGVVWLTQGAEFLSLALIVVYVGAVMVLFLFVIMMFDLNTDKEVHNLKGKMLLPTVFGCLLLVELSTAITCSKYLYTDGPLDKILSLGASRYPAESNAHLLGYLLFTDYIYPFELAGALLMFAVLAAVSISWTAKKDRKRQNIAEQVAVDPRKRLTLVKVPSEKNDIQEQ